MANSPGSTPSIHILSAGNGTPNSSVIIWTASGDGHAPFLARPTTLTERWLHKPGGCCSTEFEARFAIFQFERVGIGDRALSNDVEQDRMRLGVGDGLCDLFALNLADHENLHS